MVEYSTEEHVLLHLEALVPTEGGDVPAAATVGGISDAVGLDGETMADRIQLLSTLEALTDEGLVAERTAGVDGDRDSRRAYLPTEDGQERAVELRRSLADERIRVETGDGAERVRLGAVDRYFDERPLVSALARETDGVVRIDDATEREDEGLVGRTAPLSRIETALSAVGDGGSRVLAIGGEPGVGKTTLADAAIRRARERGFAVAGGKCAADVTDPHAPLAAAFGDLEGTGPELFEGTGVAPDDQEAFEAERKSLFYEVRLALERATAERPLVLFLDDVHWADDATVAVLSYLLSDPSDRVLFLLTYRRESLHEADLDDALYDRLDDDDATIDLEPFDRAETRTLVERLLGTHPVPESFADEVYERTGGNPLFVEETVEWLRERGRVDPSLSVYPDSLAAVSTPDRAREAIAQRLDPLDDDVREVLAYLAVAGGDLPTGLLAAATDVPSATVRDYVDLLAEGDLLERADDGVRFASDVVREAVRDRVDDDREPRLHGDLAAAYTDDGIVADGDRPHGEIARHYERAGDRERAIEYYRCAAADATDVYAHSLAVERYSRALELAQETDESAAVTDLTESLARVHYLAGEYDEARRYCRFVRQESDDGRALLSVARDESALLIDRAEYDAALSVVEDALDAWDGESNREVAYNLYETKARAFRERGSLDEAERIQRGALSLARAVDDPALIGAAQHGLAAVEVERGAMDDARGDLKEAVATLEGTGAPGKLAETLRTLGNAHWWAGDLDAARDAYERTLDLAREMDDPVREAVAHLSLAITDFKQGHWDAGMEHNRAGLARAEDLDLPSTRATILGNAAEMRLYGGDLATAAEEFERALSIFEDLETVRSRWKVVNMDAKRRIVAGDLDAAERRLRESRATLADADIGEAEAEALELLGRCHRERGRGEDALSCHETALSLAEAGGSSRAVAVRCELARDHLTVGDAARAVEVAERAHEDAVEMEDAVRTVRAELTLGACYRAVGRHETAAETLRRALDGARGMDADYFVARARYERGRLAADRGDDGTARERLRAARDAADEMGAETLARRAGDALEEF